MRDIKQQLEQRRQHGLYRKRKVLESPQGRTIALDGYKLLNFCSNDYLGLANHPLVKQAFIQGTDQYGVGSGSAHLVNGHSLAHYQLEESLAEFSGYPRALLFSTGYMANLAVAQSLCQRGDFIIEDKLNHASLLDAAQLSNGKLKRYQHLDYESLQLQLASCSKGEKLVCSDAVFSMDGDETDIKQLQQACNQHDAWLMLDDAHGFGVLGDNGQGSLNHQQLAEKPPIYMATLGKAAGTAGAFVAGSDELIEHLIQTARSYIYTTAMPPAIAIATQQSLKLFSQENWRQQALLKNIDHFKALSEQAQIALMPSNTAIQPVLIGDASQTLSISQQLFLQGFHVAAIRPPTVPENTARLRITLRADHTSEDLQQLVNSLASILS